MTRSTGHKDSEHSHWSGFDENLEMLEFDRLQYMCRLGETVVEGDWNRLIRLASAAGYGDADSFLSDFGLDDSNDDAEAMAHRSAFDDYQNGEYWSAIDRSERILSDAGGEGANREFARKVCDLVRDAYDRGREQRIAIEAPAPGPR